MLQMTQVAVLVIMLVLVPVSVALVLVALVAVVAMTRSNGVELYRLLLHWPAPVPLVGNHCYFFLRNKGMSLRRQPSVPSGIFRSVLGR
ncbi:unnamed protein product [Gongylonema pulchrum]|uniref:Uncharacterized protein n=1 Tax=Gongylonema pulchrum TaxID=637853 RepID=A0A3P7MF84_9BILA|nr:unnamed protein product [Gongylonema pulchrum]